MKGHGRVEVHLHSFLTPPLYGGVRLVSPPVCFTPGERTPVSYLGGDWVGHRAGLGVMKKRKITCQNRESKYDILVFQPVA